MSALASLLALILLACGPADRPEAPTVEVGPGLSPGARAETVELLRSDRDADRHPSDGGGRAWLETTDSVPAAHASPAGSPQRFVIVYEAGPLGVAEGGVVFLQPSPFWGWDSPQLQVPDAPGFCEVATPAAGVELRPDDALRGVLAIEIAGRALAAGERVRIVYGAGPAGARVDRFAEAESRLWVAVDGDGDGVRSVLPESPGVEVVARQPVRLLVHGPTTARPGERVRFTFAAVDEVGNAGAPVAGAVVFEERPPGLDLPARVEIEPRHAGRRSIEIFAGQAGVYRLRVRGEAGLEGLTAESNPLVVRPDLPHIRWGDLHGHSQLSDGSATPEQYFDYAREVAGLDVAALTDHDHWGMQPLDATPELWERIQQAVRRAHVPSRFVSLLGYEWTSWLHGHRHVLYFADAGDIYSSLDPDYETPAQLWAALRGRPALTFAHHSAGGPIATNWRFAPDAELEPLTEIVSVHGSSESADSPGRIYDPVPGNSVRDALDHGYVLGFLGSGDSHDGHPGLAHLASASGQGGLAAIFSEELTREGLLAAMKARRVYATNGVRLWLDVHIDGHPMGATLETNAEAGPSRLEVEVVASAPIDRIDLVRSGRTATLPGEGRLEWSFSREIPPLARGEYHYLRIVQQDGGVAWSSPVFAR